MAKNTFGLVLIQLVVQKFDSGAGRLFRCVFHFLINHQDLLEAAWGLESDKSRGLHYSLEGLKVPDHYLVFFDTTLAVGEGRGGKSVLQIFLW